MNLIALDTDTDFDIAVIRRHLTKNAKALGIVDLFGKPAVRVYSTSLVTVSTGHNARVGRPVTEIRIAVIADDKGLALAAAAALTDYPVTVER